MSWKLVYLPEAAKDLKNLAGNQRLLVVIGARADDEVYETAQHRAQKNHL